MRPERKYAQVVAQQQDCRDCDQRDVQFEQRSHRSPGLRGVHPQTKPQDPKNALMKASRLFPEKPTTARAISTVGATARPGNRSHQLAKKRMTHPSVGLSRSRVYTNVTCWTIAAGWPLWTPPRGGSLGAAEHYGHSLVPELVLIR